MTSSSKRNVSPHTSARAPNDEEAMFNLNICLTRNPGIALFVASSLIQLMLGNSRGTWLQICILLAGGKIARDLADYIKYCQLKKQICSRSRWRHAQIHRHFQFESINRLYRLIYLSEKTHSAARLLIIESRVHQRFCCWSLLGDEYRRMNALALNSITSFGSEPICLFLFIVLVESFSFSL